MFYGDCENICLAKSKDGKIFSRVFNEMGTPAVFTGPYWNTRDAMTLKHDDLYYCYYTGHTKDEEPNAAIFCRTSADLDKWSKPVMVSGGGSPVGKARGLAEMQNAHLLWKKMDYFTCFGTSGMERLT